MKDLVDVDAIIDRVSGSPIALVNVARTLLLARGEGARARALCARALQMSKDDGEVAAIAAEVLSADVASWYYRMVRDTRRHSAYERALGKALSAGGRVLDIGAGTGLFAMMAARAGADQVVACEMNSAVAEAARDVVAKNGLQDRVTIVEKASTELAVGVDLEGPADVLIWDNLSHSLIGGGALATLEDAQRRLVKPGAKLLPARGAIKAAFAEDLKLDHRRMHAVGGFDLSPFNRFAQPFYTLRCDSEDLEIRSTATTLFDFDFQSGGPFPAQRATAEVIGNGGVANGVVQWLELELDEDERYDTAPGRSAQAFALLFHPMAEPVEVTKAKVFSICASHDRQRLWIWREVG